MRTTTRYEAKYKINSAQLYQVRNDLIAGPMQLDFYSQKQPYFVRSLYFDSDDFLAYRENLGGHWGRTKLRIRTYSPAPNDNLSIELKTKFGNKSVKYNTFISYAWYQQFMATGQFPDSSDPVLAEFARVAYLKTFKPKVLIQYRREGFFSKTSPSLRMTFDSQMESVHASDLFPDKPIFRRLAYNGIILEIKYLPQQPLWINRLVKRHDLQWIANSKYSQSVELARFDVVSASAKEGRLQQTRGFQVPTQRMKGVEV